ncbi:MAG: hypothetical protein Q8R04_01915 [Nanoarchaeota archaeon]|nr:hypothetical protein [Nanoarchaeota archaeon]
MSPKFNFKWSVIWIIIHSISLFILAIVLQYFNVKNGIIQILFIGFGVTIIARLVKRITKKRQFIVDKWFFFWSIINTFTIWSILLLINVLPITNNLLSLFLIAIGLVIIAYFVKRLKITRTTMIITSIILFIVLLLFNSNSSILSDANSKIFSTQTVSAKSNNILSSIKESIQSIPSSIFGETVEVNLRIACDTMSNFEDLEMEDIGNKIIRRGCEDVCPAKTTKYSGSYSCDTNSGFIMCSCKLTQEGKQLVNNLKIEEERRIAGKIEDSVYDSCFNVCYKICKYNEPAELPSGYTCQCSCGTDGIPEMFKPIKNP